MFSAPGLFRGKLLNWKKLRVGVRGDLHSGGFRSIKFVFNISALHFRVIAFAVIPL